MSHPNVVDLLTGVPLGTSYWRSIDGAIYRQMLYDLAYPPSPMLAPAPTPLPPQDVPLPSTWPIVPVEKRRVDNESFSIDHLISPKTNSRREGARTSRTLAKFLPSEVSERQKRVENLERIIGLLRRTRLEQQAKLKKMRVEAVRETKNARERERRAKKRFVEGLEKGAGFTIGNHLA